MLIACVLHIRPEGHWEPRNEVGSQSLAERLVGFELGTFWFWSHCLNPLGHSPHSLLTLPKLLKCPFLYFAHIYITIQDQILHQMQPTLPGMIVIDLFIF